MAVMVCLPNEPEDRLNAYVFHLAILIKKGVHRVRSAYLGSLHEQLDECIGNIVGAVVPYDVLRVLSRVSFKSFSRRDFTRLHQNPRNSPQ